MNRDKKWIRFIVLLFSLLMSVFPVLIGAEAPITLPPQAIPFIDTMVKQHHFDREQLKLLLTKARYDKDVITKITHPHEEKPWNIYRNYFITEQRIQEGVRYWEAHKEALTYAQRHYGIPASLIVAIIGVETNYGKNKGEHSAFDALTTLAFYYAQRSPFFTKELTHFLLLTQEQHFPVLFIKSSYAGALGIPQFMPSVYRQYAVHYTHNNGKNRADLIDNDNDAIVSIANYLHRHGWKKNQPIACLLDAKTAWDGRWVSSSKIQLKKTIRQFKKMGIYPVISIVDWQKAAIVELDASGNKEHWFAFHNFKVLMSYNPRIVYTMAVYQLSEMIQQTYEQKTA